ncbi:MAG: hypothetical protein MZV49_25420 [Rhodopseudomonas palustris]|nr:hypothetical protein [Rhodopseudomonas palustris]
MAMAYRGGMDHTASAPSRMMSCAIIARFSGFGLLAYGYIKFWDYGGGHLLRTHARRQPGLFALLQQQTPYTFSFWVVEVILRDCDPSHPVPRRRASARNPADWPCGRASCHDGHHRQSLECDRVGACSSRCRIRPARCMNSRIGSYFAQPDRMGASHIW